ncbi:Prolipoprotein diacylglyceryl transferase [Chthonomonas calidirosea]|uniref:Phosphatidylglycerol--prolipoprotein diacylglyceryl transferase n=1 Tax=Chthonomonas calidirosea (strain DSM 23976 / ICMP 18418 / T49) TaxID=1303518 RepID=S0EZ78_CHTCT|nr:prolipoprotein diacylglyceryl transferase [Chthonomonas calidirosea]CCW35550.1 Prolipoprotein diacylglyceryl transferase [Chthonomonas calidirosea T49]CEK19938.1 Prolipoprotein diacylglyceryl transferase [Chthonomonas calidirosea]
MHPILFHIGHYAVHSYGVLIMLGVLLATRYAMRLCDYRMRVCPVGSPRRIHPDVIFDVAFFGVIFSIIGARLVFVLLDWGDYAAHPLDIFRIWMGGLSIHGALLFAIFTLLWICRSRKLSFYAVADIGATAWPLGYAIGRIGCLLNGCCYGAPTSLPWGIRFPDEDHPGQLTPPSHPIQLYATLINLGFFWWLTRWQKRSRRDGELFWAYIAMYGAYRFAVEFLRAGATSTYRIPSLHITDTHIVSVLMILIGLWGLFALRRRYQAYADTELPPEVATAPLPKGLSEENVSADPRESVATASQQEISPSLVNTSVKEKPS